MKKLKNMLFEEVLYPVYQMRYGTTHGIKILRTLKHLNKLQWSSRERLIDYQNIKLGKLIKHVYHNVPYYEDMMRSKGIVPDDIRTIDDLKGFPILSKEIIRTNFPKIISKGANRRNLRKFKTGGSTGEPLTLFRDKNTMMWQEAALLRGWAWAGYNIGDTVINFSYYDMNRISILGKMRSRLIKLYFYYALAKKEQLSKYLNEIKSLDPFCLSGLASSLCRNAGLIEKYNMNGFRIPVIFSYGEMLHSHQRTLLESSFKGTVYDYYGCNEIGSMAYECEYHNKHITEEHVILETVNSNGSDVVDTSGNIILTDLDNYAMPFIRYQVDDAGTLASGECNCKRGLRILKSLDGRSQEFLKTPDGKHVPMISFLYNFNRLQGIEQYQIIQTGFHNITLKIVKNNFYSPRDSEAMVRVIKEKIGNKVNVIVEECDHIPLTARGKTRLIISHLPTYF
ncbi:MAG: phenylacetate--CoA ligase family protein [Nitrospirae bacterium]|nr:phenylacetate--CoA ligase family protein [Nitrospirota bacterium]